MVLSTITNNLQSNIVQYGISSDFYQVKESLYDLENKYLNSCEKEQFTMLKIIIQELNMAYKLMPELFEMRKQHSMY